MKFVLLMHIGPTTTVSIFCVAFHIFVVDEHRDFKFGVTVDHSKSQPTYNKLSRDPFKFLVPLKYLWNGLS